MDVGLEPLEFTDCLTDSPFFRENLHAHERELQKTSQQIKRLVKEVKDLINAAKNLSNAQRKLSKSLEEFSFECIGTTQTDDERVILDSLKEFGILISKIEDVRDQVLGCAGEQIINPLDKFRKEHIGGVKEGKKKFEKQTAKFCQSQERYLNLSMKKQDAQLKEADATLDMEEREFCQASLRYVFLLQAVQERKKFEFVETLLGFMFSWLTFYHQGHDVYEEFKPYMTDLQLKIQKTRENFNATRDKTESLMNKMLEMRQQKPLDPAYAREGYLFLMEKKAFGTTWTKQYCRYKKDTKEFEMIPYNQMTTKTLIPGEKLKLASCTRRMSDSIEKRFCFDLIPEDRPSMVYTLQALSEADRRLWMDVMDGKEPTYAAPGNVPKTEERQLDETGVGFVKKCIEVLESRGLEEQGLYRVVGVNSKVNKLLIMGLDRRKGDKLLLDDATEWESKTVTSALKTYLRNLPEPLMTFRYHRCFIEAAQKSPSSLRINEVHTLIHRLPTENFKVLDILVKHLTNVAAKADKNLMTVSNLGVCFGPTLLRPEEETVAAIMDIKFCNIVVEILIENYEKIFKTEPQVTHINLVQKPRANHHHQGIVYGVNNRNAVGLSYEHNTSQFTGNISPTQQQHQQQQQLVRPPPRHQYLNNPNPVTHAVIKTYYNDGPASVNLSSSLHSVQSTRERERSGSAVGVVDWIDKDVPVSERDSLQLKRGGVVAGRVAAFSEGNIHVLNSQHNYTQRPGYCYTNTINSDRSDALNSTSSSNESVSSSPRDMWREEDHYQTSPLLNKRAGPGLKLHYPPNYRPPVDNVVPFSLPTCSTTNTTLANHQHQQHIQHQQPHQSPVVRRVRTLYACLGENDGELSFDPNQIITNVRASLEPGWLEGTLNGRTGLVPENYVELLP